jgi:starch phosphorylase
MTAAMNGSVNFSIPDGWVPEFAHHGKNSFLIKPVADNLTQEEKDKLEAKNLLDVLEHEIIPMYYEQPERWAELMKTSMREVTPFFDAGRMADEYYQRLYHFEAQARTESKIAALREAV